MKGKTNKVKVTASKAKASKTTMSVTARQLNGRKGGLKTASKYTHEQRQEWGSKAGSSTLRKYGKGFFKHIRKKRTEYPVPSRVRRKD